MVTDIFHRLTTDPQVATKTEKLPLFFNLFQIISILANKYDQHMCKISVKLIICFRNIVAKTRTKSYQLQSWILSQLKSAKMGISTKSNNVQ